MSKGIVIKTVASLKLHPNMESELADEVLYGMIVELIESVDDKWCFVKTQYNYEGYMNKEDIILDDNLANNWVKENNYVINQSIIDVMTEPKYASYPFLVLTRGALVKATGVTEDKWEKIILADGKEGWIRKGFANVMKKSSIGENEEEIRKSIVEAAMKYMGTQYRWGGKSPFGIDCSGLASMAYMLNGLIIPRDANIQQDYLKAIDRTTIKAGDLAFFPGHVAVCIGEGRYIHATGREGYVLVNSFNPNHEEYREDLDKNCTGIGSIF